MKRIVMLTVLLVLICLLASCSKTYETSDHLTTETPTSTQDARYLDLSGYTVIHPEEQPSKLRIAIDDLLSYAEKRGAVLTREKDTASAESTEEILFGMTNRSESQTAQSLLGDGDYYIGVIGTKLVVYAKDAASYPFAIKKLLNLVQEGTLMIEKTQSQSYSVIYRETTDQTVKKNETVSLSVKLLSSQSKATVFFDSTVKTEDRGYALVVEKQMLTFYSRIGDQLTVMGRKTLPIAINRAYGLRFVFDESYCTFYFLDDMEGVEAWPEFDLKVEIAEALRIGFGEESGYGAEFTACQVAPTDNDHKDGATYCNPLILDHADPDILYHNGVYYLFATSKGYDCYTSTDMVNWTYRGKSLPQGGWGVDNQYWAPDVEEIDGKFYMAVSFGEEGFGIAVAEQPEGPYICQGDVPLLKKTIDGHIFVDDDGRVYLYYTSWYDGRSYGIYGVEMSDDLITPKWETEVKILTPAKEWEKHEGDVIEAPYMLKQNGRYYLIYSASHTKSKYYAVGYAISQSPLSGFRRSEDSPILLLTSDVHGTGHCSVITAPDQKTLLIVYHCHYSTETPYPRHTCIDRIRFAPTESGIDRLEVWGPTTRESDVTWIQ